MTAGDDAAAPGVRPSAGADVTFLAEFGVSHPELVLDHAVRTVRRPTVRTDYCTTDDAGEPLLFLRASGDGFDGLEAALRADDTVADPALVAAADDTRVYRVRVATHLRLLPRRPAALGTRLLDARGGDLGWRLRLQFLAREALDAFHEHCREHDVRYRVYELSRSAGVREAHSVGMTDGQRAALLLAYRTGYFDVPRGTCQDALATELGVSSSAVSQRLRRATATLVGNTLALEDGADDRAE